MCQSALKSQISSSLCGLVLVLELAAQEEGSGGGSRVVLPKDVNPTWAPVLYEQFLSGLVGFTAVFNSSFHISYQGAASRPQGRLFLSVGSQFAVAISSVCFADKKNLFRLLPCFSQIATELLMLTCTLADREISWCVVKHTIFCQALPAYHFHATFHATLPLELHCQVYSNLCPSIYLLWKSHPSTLPVFHAFCHLVQWVTWC